LSKSTIRYVDEHATVKWDAQSEKDLKPMLMDIPATRASPEQTVVVEGGCSRDGNFFTPPLMVSFFN